MLPYPWSTKARVFCFFRVKAPMFGVWRNPTSTAWLFLVLPISFLEGFAIDWVRSLFLWSESAPAC